MTESGVRVMLVISSSVERTGLREVIESCPRFKVVAEASLAQTALGFAAETRPDIAAVEYELIDATGLDLSHRLVHLHPSIGTLLFADRFNEEWIADALRAGVRGFVSKNGVDRHLISALDALADHRPFWDDAIDEELFNRLIGGPPLPPNAMTRRERQIVHLVAQGLSNEVIAHRLKLSPKTVESLRTDLRRKYRLRNTADIVRYAVSYDFLWN